MTNLLLTLISRFYTDVTECELHRKVDLFIATLEDKQVFITQCNCPNHEGDNTSRGAECPIQTEGGAGGFLA